MTGINANLRVGDLAVARGSYQEYFGLSVEEFNLGLVARYSTPDGLASVQLVASDATPADVPKPTRCPSVTTGREQHR